MKPKQQSKEYKTPQFRLVRQDEQNKVFFTGSGGPSFGGSLKAMSSTSSAW